MGELKYIRKRDGRLVVFDRNKISDAIFRAVKAVGGEDKKPTEEVTDQIVMILETVFKKDVPSVETVQDLVEKMLVENGHAKVAKSYILYREQHARLREAKGLLSEAINIVDNYIGKNDWRVNENSNMGYSLQGLNQHISSIITSHYWLNKIYPEEIRRTHMEGDFHIHDLGQLSVYCCGWDLKDLLVRGFGGVFGKVESKPPKRFRTALGQLVNFFYTLQGEAAGAQAVANFDTLLAPFIRYDKLEYREVKQCMQEFIFNMNVPTRVGFQTPFTNITMDLIPSPVLKDEAVVIGGEIKNDKYGDFQDEMNLINKAFCEIMMEGDAKGRIFSFPIPTYNITKDFDWDNPELLPLWEMTSKYGIPYFSNFINSDMKPEDARSMCCRLRLDNRELRKRGGGLFGANPLTGSVGVVTINMPRLGFTSKNEKEFIEKLDNLMVLAKDSLELKRKVLERFTEHNLYPYSKHYLDGIKERFETYWANHFSTIGLNGMNEAVLNLLGKPISSDEGKDFAIRIMDHMREKMISFQEETGYLYNLEATPAEGVSYRLAKKDKDRYPGIIQSGDAEPYYTNSTHLPVDFTNDLFNALSHQDELQCKYTGGTVFHGFLGERIDDPLMCKKVVRKIAENFHLPYYTITPTFTICPVHGYIAGEHFFCPYTDHDKDGKEILDDIDLSLKSEKKGKRKTA
jgi:ribonucleoside-triphosphate reductase